MLYDGNRWHHADLYSHVFNAQDPEAPGALDALLGN